MTLSCFAKPALYKQKLRVLFRFITLPRGLRPESSWRSSLYHLPTIWGPWHGQGWLSKRQALINSQPSLSAHIRVSAANPAMARWEGTISLKLSFSGHLCIMEFPGRDLGLDAWPRLKGSPEPHPVSECENHPAGCLPSSRLQRKRKGCWEWLWVPTRNVPAPDSTALCLGESVFSPGRGESVL